MASLTTTTADAALKQLYKSANFKESTYKRRPIIGLLPKDEGFFGRNMPIVNHYGRPQGVSATFSDAVANTTSALLEDFLLTRVNEHSVATVAGEALDAMSNDAGSFVTAMKVQVDGALKALADRLETLAPRTGTGSIGVVGTYAGTPATSFTLENINDVHNFEVGMSLTHSVADGGALADTAAAIVVTDVNRLTGVINTAADIAASWTTCTDDYVYAEGDEAASGTYKVMSGLGAWVPASDPISTAFFGVDRTADITRLGGVRHTATGLVKTAIMDGASITSALGGAPDTALMHHVKYRQLCKELDSQTNYTKIPSRGNKGNDFARVSYTGVEVLTDAGPVACVAANKIPSGQIFLLEVATWILASIGPMTKFNSPDGMRILRQSSADGIEARLVFRGNMGCRQPGANCNISHS